MTTPWDAFEALCRAGALADVDVHFARFAARLDGRERPEIAFAGCAVSQAAGAGHVCADLPALAGRPLAVVDDAEVAVPAAPPLAEWLDALQSSPIVGEPGVVRPLVLDDAGRLYLHRLWTDERAIAEHLVAHAGAALPVDRARLRADVAQLFAGGAAEHPDWQRIAATVAVLRGATVISGGPGTGKTSTVVRVLALLARQQTQPLRIALAAPTGKAASRLLEAVRHAAADLPSGWLSAEVLPAEARTLHRLLGRRRSGGDDARPLPYDVVVVDEASMVDLPLMARLVRRLLPSTRLVLLGDKDQLASVEAGAVLADVCGPTPGLSADAAADLADIVGEAVPAGAPLETAPLRDAVVLLQHSYRFGATSGIGRLAGAVNDGDGPRALAVLHDAAHHDVAWHAVATPADLALHLDAAVEAYAQLAHAVRAGDDPAAIFRRFAAFRVLCAVRRGPFGVETVNRRLVAALAQRGLLDPRARWYPGRPVLITQNDYGVGLFNGDVGIALPVDGALRVHFEGGDGVVRTVAPVRLPAHETVYAMTVHKAQGSEFDDIVLILPPDDVAVLTRELLYTAVTRARQRVAVWGVAETFRTAVARRVTRSSGLRDALWPAER